MSRHLQTFVPPPPPPPRRTKAIRRASKTNAPPNTPSFPPSTWPETEIINLADREPAFPQLHKPTEAASSKKRRSQQATSRQVAEPC